VVALVTAVYPTRLAVPRRRGGWLGVGLLLAVVMIAFGSTDVVSLLAHEPFDRSRVWAGPVRSLDLSVGDGSVTVVGAERTGAVVDATGNQGLEKPSDNESLTDGRLSIRSSCRLGRDHLLRGALLNSGDTWCNLNYRITVPYGTAVTAHSGDGDVKVSGLTGALNLSSGDGDVLVAGGDGTLRLSSGDGDVHVSGSHSRQVTATSGDGDIDVELLTVPTQVTAHSGDGDVAVTVPPGPDLYQVTAHSGDGGQTTAVRTAPTSAHRIVATSGDGDVSVAYGSA
jgi:Putative adhesin